MDRLSAGRMNELMAARALLQKIADTMMRDYPESPWLPNTEAEPLLAEIRALVTNCPACGVAYVLGARHFSECKLNPGATALSGGTVDDA